MKKSLFILVHVFAFELIIAQSQTPYLGTAFTIPCKIEAEYFDIGGEGISFHDNEPARQGNPPSTFRTADAYPVDFAGWASPSNGLGIGFCVKDEWYEYTINVPAEGYYDFYLGMAGTGTTNKVLFYLNDVRQDSIIFSGTGSYNVWAQTKEYCTIKQTKEYCTLKLTKGDHVLKMFIASNGYNVDYINIVESPITLSKRYKVEIMKNSNWINHEIYEDSRMSIDPYYFQNQSPKVHFTTICMDSTTDVRVIRLSGNAWSSVVLEPEAYGITPVFNADTILFTIRNLQKTTLKINNSLHDLLCIFANPPKPQIPSGAKYFAPGYHKIGVDYQLASNERVVYIDEGAWVEGSFDVSYAGGDVIFMGPGIITGRFDTNENLIASMSVELRKERNLIHATNSVNNNIVIDGITMVKSPYYSIYLSSVNGTKKISNVHIISPWTYNTDAFNTGGKTDIRNSYAFNNDDKAFAEYSYSSNVDISDCVFAGRNSFLIGYGYFSNVNNFKTNIANVECILQEDREPFRAEVDGASSAILIDYQYYNDITINGNCRRLFDIQNKNTTWGHANDALGNIRNLYFNNITLTGNQTYKSIIKGKNQDNRIEMVINNLKINGTTITNFNYQQYFDIDASTASVKFLAPYDSTHFLIPCRIEAEKFDIGGQGVSYNDVNAGRAGGNLTYRISDAPDVEFVNSSGASNNWSVQWIGTGEWYEYSIKVPDDDIYVFNLGYSSPNNGNKVHFLINGVLRDSLVFNSSGSWSVFVQSTDSCKIALNKGTHILRFYVAKNGFNIDYIQIARAFQAPYNSTPFAIPGLIEAEEFDLGGQGVAYEDTTPGRPTSGYNLTYRANDAPDVDFATWNNPGNGYCIGGISTGEWLEYTISVANDGYYKIYVGYGSPNDNNKIEFYLNGVSAGELLFNKNHSSSWSSWSKSSNYSLVFIPAGTHVLRAKMLTGTFNIDYFSIETAEQGWQSILSGKQESTSTIEIADFELKQNYPNPFVSTTRIRFSIAETDFVKLVIYNSQGQLIQILANEKMEAGMYDYLFNGSNLPSGVYFCRLVSKGKSLIKKMQINK